MNTTHQSNTLDASEPDFALQHSARTVRGYKGKGGGGGRIAKEAPDSLHSTQYARIQDAINIGPMGELGATPEDVLRNVYLDGTPIIGEDGTENFPGVEVHVRYGTQTQDPIPGFPGAENTHSVGMQIKQSQGWTQLVSNTGIDAVRITLSTDRLAEQNTKNGDLNGYFIDYIIEMMSAGGAWEPAVTASMRGKTTQRYTRTHRVDLPPGTGPWTLRVRRLSADATSGAIQSNLFVDAYTEVVDTKLRHPMVAMVGYKIPASLFTSIPTRAIRGKGRQIRVPSNYDASSRAYAGVWDGTFKLSVCANPAWVLLDIITNDIFGLGQRINLGMVDRWTFYQIAQYCDEMVPDGLGGMEPRFRCVGQIMKREDAYRVLQDVASIFHGMVYALNGTVTARADMPGNPVYTYSRANIIGEFEFSGTSRKTNYNVMRVSYTNAEDFGRQKVEVAEDAASIARIGLRDGETTAFMCYSRSQANRMARWAIMTSQVQNRLVKFSVGLDYALVKPGEVVYVADNILAGAMISGRFRKVISRSVVVLDRTARVKPGDMLLANLPDGSCEERRVNAVDVSDDEIRLTLSPFTSAPLDEAIWCVQSEDLKPFQFRIQEVTLTGPMEAQITAVLEVPGKHASVDFETQLDLPDNSVVPSLLMAAPSDVRLSSHSSVDQNMAQHAMRIEWKGSKEARGYSVQWRRDNSDWIGLPDTGSESVEISGIRAGRYQARVQAVSALDVRSAWVVSGLQALSGNLQPPPTVAYLTASSNQLYGISVKWGFRDSVSPVRRAELWFSPNSSFLDASKLSEISYPGDTFSVNGLPAGTQYWFWIRLVDSTGEEGEFYPAISVPGVYGITNTDAKDYLDAIKEEVVSSELGQKLFEDIGVISSGLGDLGRTVTEQGETLSGHGQSLITQSEALRLEVEARVEASDALGQSLALQAQALQQGLAGEAQARQIGLAAEAKDRGQSLLSEASLRQEGMDALSAALQQEVQERMAAVDTTETSLNAQISALHAEIADLQGILPWDASKAYEAGVIVSWEGRLYSATVANDGVEPSDPGVWEKIGDYSSLSAAVGDIGARVGSAEIVQAGHATKLSGLEATQAQQGSRVTTLERTSLDQGQRLSSVETESADSASKIQTLDTTTAELARHTTTLDTRSANADNKITALEETTADHALRMGELRATAADQDGSISNLEQVSASHASSLHWMGVRQGELQSSIEEVDSVTASLAQRATTLESFQGQHGSKISTLESATSQLTNRTSSLETVQGQQSSKITAVEETQGSQAQRLSGLESTQDQHTSKLFSLEETTADYALRMGELRATAADQDGAITSLERVSANSASSLFRLNARQGDLKSSIERLDEVSAAMAQRTGTLETTQGQQGSKVGALEQTTLTQGTRLGSLETAQGQHASKIATIEQTQSGQAQRLSTMETTQGAQGGKIATLEQTSSGLAQRTSTLEASATTLSSQVRTLEEAGADAALRLMEVRATAADTDSAVSELAQASKENARTSSRISARTDQNAASIIEERDARTSENLALANRLVLVEAQKAETFDAERSWSFDSGAEGWKAFNAPNAEVSWIKESPYFVRAVPLVGTGIGRLDRVLTVGERYDPKVNPVVRARVRFPNGCPSGTFQIYVAIDGGTGTGTNTQLRPVSKTSTDWQVVDFDLMAINELVSSAENISRIILGDTRTASNGVFEVDFVGVGRYGAPISRAAFLSETTALAEKGSVNASNIQAVQTQLGTVKSTVDTTSESLQNLDGKLAASWTVRVQQDTNKQKYLAGIGVGIESDGNGGTVQSTIAMIADQFVLMSQVGAAPEAVFSVDRGQAFLRSAFIQDGTITNAKIGNLQVTSAKISDAAISNAKIADGAINTAKISDASISTAKIGVAQIDTLRIANGSVVTGQVTSFNISYSRADGSDYVTLAINLPYGGTPIIFWDATMGAFSSDQPGNRTNVQIRTNHYGTIYDESPIAGVQLPNYNYWRHQGFHIGTSLPSGSTFVVDFVGARPNIGSATWRGRASIMVFQR